MSLLLPANATASACEVPFNQLQLSSRQMLCDHPAQNKTGEQDPQTSRNKALSSDYCKGLATVWDRMMRWKNHPTAPSLQSSQTIDHCGVPTGCQARFCCHCSAAPASSRSSCTTGKVSLNSSAPTTVRHACIRSSSYLLLPACKHVAQYVC